MVLEKNGYFVYMRDHERYDSMDDPPLCIGKLINEIIIIVAKVNVDPYAVARTDGYLVCMNTSAAAAADIAIENYTRK